MAAYNCTLFLNTGFNTINIPDSPALVNGMSSISVPALDINQERFLPSVRVRATWTQVKDADYCKVGDFYYTINSITMTSQDVAEISLTPDYITSAGGPAALEILDGLTNRVHVSDDSFGLYGGNDPYMNPAYDMDIDSYQVIIAASSTTFVETTLSLDSLGFNFENNSLQAYTAYDQNDETGEKHVVVPVAAYLQASTSYSAQIGGASQALRNVKKQGLYTLTDSDTGHVGKGMNVARSLGIENAISGQFEIPNTMFTMTQVGDFVTTITGVTQDTGILGLPFVYGSANNNRVWYGSQSAYTLVSAAGNTLSAKPEEIYSAGATVPTVRRIVDPRRTGKPYYRFMPLNGNSGTYDFFRGAVAGNPWDSVPMVLTEKSGGLLDRANYAASVARRDLADVYEETGYNWNKGVNLVGSAFKNTVAGLSGQGNMGIGGGIAGIGNFELGHMAYQETSAQERAIEKAQFQIQQNVNVPDVKFPYTPDLMNEVLHNGFMVFRNKYKAQDIARIDKILTAFGYKYVKVLEASDFSNRQKFNYVEGSITVGNLPKWWADGISSQITGGVRVWHIKPTHTAYSSNPIA